MLSASGSAWCLEVCSELDIIGDSQPSILLRWNHPDKLRSHGGIGVLLKEAKRAGKTSKSSLLTGNCILSLKMRHTCKCFHEVRR